jgi:hypothetical protein
MRDRPTLLPESEDQLVGYAGVGTGRDDGNWACVAGELASLQPSAQSNVPKHQGLRVCMETCPPIWRPGEELYSLRLPLTPRSYKQLVASA